ncbi:dTDP-4-dehydrorhamnose 3,5-epimerase family protein [Desulfolutivibrio sulfoxidireducens]|uniref:dTDP-4-dehydrorhamnose 3,5-epimerase family protein n=1 Tax=Desulfolutivibrio sulfoxidireducens TaxID=2773299 RepID=UPI00159EA342|nr:dTDP-4-dehydrorhamnose 3,5-epimerase family protein [Desulfolutivibrio sulfoxidireducens]QLA18213.1 dTDP-4-dehydrorhamnose 3,5-epimerase [Desulfolutivibrio sulfoxidireducens]
MRFQETLLPGVLEIHLSPHEDERGSFARIWCREEFEKAGCPFVPEQISVSRNHRRGVLRGMHLQAAPHGEHKLVRCERGAIHDVALDLRPASPTYLRWIAVELSAENEKALFLPPGVAHGFQTLAADAVVCYMITPGYCPQAACGFRHNDPAFGIRWPLPDPILSPKDQCWPDFDPTSPPA